MAKSPSTPDARRRETQRVAAAAAAEAKTLFRFRRTHGWPGIVGQLVLTLRSAMVAVARDAQPYAAKFSPDPDLFGEVAPAAFGRTASDGRPLESLLEQPHLEVARLERRDVPAGQAERVGLARLERIVRTQVADVSRVSTGVAIANDRALKGYIRHLTLPSCNRCIILAGRIYRYSTGFKRHPLCDCQMTPLAEMDPDLTPSPQHIYQDLTDEQRRAAGWTEADIRALDDGADLNQVTNAHREISKLPVAGRLVNTTGVRFRGQRVKTRLTPEAIYAEANRLHWTRTEALQQLKQHGYIL